ncbi:enoyl-CoA hydratase/isomerase family protein [Fulvivirga sp. RKSG066]|uniref:enoyl-CoA hydratase/isomerase family protein n=1 Tax=Fulvivirga aurantia TaxID=2529383 RepID=UPI0012BC5A11|nr:enoyl-CoA hydratase-related protein [Fulvivirga aurantia]MTI20730.1 enoyl-CoA hydratase/isomerase family protein [Fulvivirga aurantia]
MEFITYEVKERIGYITLNRPDKRNALSFDVVTELKEAFTQAEQDDEVKVIVLKANGKAFCAGADLAYIQQLQKNTYQENLDDSNHLRGLFQQIYTMGKVVIAQIQGHAIAGGCGLATVCDFGFTVPEAKFGYTEVRIGFIPAIVKVFLLRKIGEMKSKELLLTGELIDAQQAKQYDLVTEVVDADKLEQRVSEFAQMLISKNSGQSMALTKQMIANVQAMDVEEGLNYAAEMNAKARGTEDCKKGIDGFLNKKPVEW